LDLHSSFTPTSPALNLHTQVLVRRAFCLLLLHTVADPLHTHDSTAHSTHVFFFGLTRY
jgi:hypothetical protein